MSEHIIKALLEQNDELKARVKELDEYVLKIIHTHSQDPAHIMKLEKNIEQLESAMKSLVENQ
jgi:predicted RNA-binding protein YlqC (UPF0109 family)